MPYKQFVFSSNNAVA